MCRNRLVNDDAQPGIGARIRAARHLAGFTDVGALAKAIDQKGLRTTTLRQMEREEIDSQPRDLEAIAHACGLPVEWFVADLTRIAELAPEDPRRVLAQRTAAAYQRAQERRASRREDPPAQQGTDQ